MVDTERMLNVIGLHSKSEEDMLVIDGTRYLAEDIIFSRVEVEATECHFVTIHHNSGKLKKIIYYHPECQNRDHLYIVTMYYSTANYELHNFISYIPNIRRLYDGDLDTIATVKRVIIKFHKARQVFCDEVMDSINSKVANPTKACKS